MSSNPKLYPSIKCKKKSSTVKVLNVDKFLYRKPKGVCSRNIAHGLDPMQIDTPCVHVFKSKLGDDSGWFGIGAILYFLIHLVTDSGWFGIIRILLYFRDHGPVETDSGVRFQYYGLRS